MLVPPSAARYVRSISRTPVRQYARAYMESLIRGCRAEREDECLA